MEKCYEYFSCSKKECVMFNIHNELMCWNVPDTLCNHDLVNKKLFEKIGINMCDVCLYFKKYNSNQELL